MACASVMVSTGRIANEGWVAAAPGAIIARVGPELAGLGASTSGIEHGRRRLIGKQLGRALERQEQALGQTARIVEVTASLLSTVT